MLVCYSSIMEITESPPDLTPGYPSKGAKIGPAWAEAWKVLSESPDPWCDGHLLCRAVAEHRSLHKDTVRGLLYRMVSGGILEREARNIKVTVTLKGKEHTQLRSRTYFRIADRKD
jgi:hypothetical protein